VLIQLFQLLLVLLLRHLVLSATCAGVLADYRSLATVADNCTATGALTVTQSPAAGTAVSGVGTTVITLTVTDASGNSANCTFNVNRVDTTLPTITCPAAQTLVLSATCAGVLADYRSLATVADNCTASGSLVVTQSPAVGTAVSGVGTTVITLTVTDASGNSANCTFNVNRVDTTLPTITCPAAQTLVLSATCAGVLADYRSLATIADNCTASGSLVVTQSPAVGTAVSGVGTTVITLTVTDASGNSANCTFNVNRVDTTLPTITCPAAQTLVLSATCAGVLADYRSLATVADNCTATGALTVTQSPAVGTAVSGVGTTVITLTVTDASGNSANCTFNVNRVDTTLPTITCPAAQTLVLSATCAGVLADYRSLATIADNCTASGSLVVTQSPAVGTAVSGVGTTVITLTVTDASGNSANCTFNVNRVDTTLPTITCPAAQTLVLSATCAGVLADYRSLATVADNCTASGSLVVTQSPAVGTAVSGVGTTVITLTVTDASGNSANCTFNVNRVDTTLPTITCPAAQTLVLSATCAGVLADYRSLATVADNCTATGALTVTQSPAVGTAVSGVGTTVITLTVTDASGNSANCTFNVNRVDTTLPTITCPAAQTLVLSATCAGVLADYRSLATVADNCTATGALTVTQSPAVGTAVSGVGTTVITLTVTDASGNSANCTFNVNRVDTTLPTITCPAAQTLVLSATCAGVLADYRSLATVADNCTATGALTVTQSPAVGTAVSGVGTTVITLTVTDASGNSANCTFNVNRVDTTLPTITCPTAQTLVLSATCAGVLADYRSLATVADNCTATGALTVTQSPAVGTAVSGVVTTVITLTVTDASGNSANCTFNVNRVDTTLPTITCPAAQTLVLSATCAGVLADYRSLATVADNCTASGALVVTQSPAAGTAVSGVGTTVITLTVTDASGNSANCTFNVNRVDTTLPTITCPAAQTLVLSATCAGVLADYRSLATIADNCTASGSLVVTQSPAVGTAVSGVGTTVITLTVTDASGNSANCTFNVNRVDTTLPTITCPAAQTLVLSATCAGVLADYRSLATVADNCTATGALTVTQSPAAGTAVSGVGTTVITLTVTDASGNSANCTFNVNRVDTTAPVVTCPGNQTIASTGACTGVLGNYVSLASATDNCTATGAITITQSPAAGTVIASATTVTITATDAAGNSSTCTFLVTPVDNTAPSITCPAAQTLTLSATCAGVLPDYTSLATVSDNCTPSASIVVTQSPAIGSAVSSVGTTTITLTATDAAGNASTCNFDVNRVDTTLPTITCPAAQTLVLSATCAGVLADYRSLATIADNCTASGSLVVTQSPAVGTAVSGVGTTVITLTVTDASGNSANCTFNVNRVDTTLPTITCPAAQTLVLSATCAGVLADYRSLATIADNCTASGSLVVTQSPAVGTAVSGVGTTVITLTVTDASGNSANCTFNVNRVDTTLPTITCPAAQTLVLSATCAGVLADYRSLATVADNCTATGALTVTQSPAAGTAVSGVGTTVITLTVTDASGNSANCTFNVNRVDTTAPVVTCPGNQTIASTGACTGVLGNYVSLASATDNCTATGAITITQSPAAGTVIASATTVTITATDAAGNSSTCTFLVTPVDNTAPSITCPAAQTLTLSATCAGVLPDYTSLATVSDNCTPSASIVVTQSPAIGSAVSSVGTTTITLTATDAAGNASTCNFDVNRVDTTLPTITCPAAQTLVLSATCAGVLADYRSLATVADNCTATDALTL
jgi:hypothetical protein